MALKHNSKTSKLFLGLCFDALGFVSFVLPVFDVIWAPLSGYLMSQLYDGKKGKIAGIIVFIEEALPFSDVIPTFSIMWIYTHYFDKTPIVKDESSN
ncbi:hypothetical protein N8480_03980 [Flavobacteriaceae bacterium]|jgi:hypothetical protein|nr:hypothetical protein [Flavobacteriaceae bacterium]MDC1539812.1 hypothetical protein [Flavobacteriaceae bacterium]